MPLPTDEAIDEHFHAVKTSSDARLQAHYQTQQAEFFRSLARHWYAQGLAYGERAARDRVDHS